MTKRFLLILLAPIVVLSACSLQQDQLPQYKVIYQILRTPDSMNVTLDQVQPVLEKRLEKLNVEQVSVTKEGDTLVATVTATRFDKGKASSLTNPFDLTLQESRPQFTATEKTAIENYNAAQKEMALDGHEKAKQTPENMDALVIQYNEKANLFDKGIHGPSSEGKVDPKYWPTLLTTDAGKITETVEKDNSIWFAKVLEKKVVKTAIGDQSIIRYQEIVRFYRDLEPRLDQVPVAHFGQYIEKALVDKKDPDSKRNKNYLISVYLNDEGKKELERISEQYKNKELRFFIDRLPHARVTFTDRDSSGILKIDDSYNQQEAEQIAVQLSMPWLPTYLSTIDFEILGK